VPESLNSSNRAAIAVVVGATGGIGRALHEALKADRRFQTVIGLNRSGDPAMDLLDEASIRHALDRAGAKGELRLVIDATGFLHDKGQRPEKSWRDLDAHSLTRAFALNATGPALLMKHVLPRLPRRGRAVFATLSARVGSIGDNRLGGWYGYRASKAALNQLVRTAAIELARTHPEALCVALHPGTVVTPLSAPFVRGGRNAVLPHEAARHLLSVIDGLGATDNGSFFDWRGAPVPW
jgi:NAD(P)-dependent dehydrogenase (short-subunit alcohol dehydrogenase family)